MVRSSLSEDESGARVSQEQDREEEGKGEGESGWRGGGLGGGR